jgi:hypothetical protein
LFISLLVFGCIPNNQDDAQGDSNVPLSGSYLGQELPGDSPELFAPGIIATGMYTRDIAISPDGNEIYYCVAIGGFAYSTILVTKQIKGEWSDPEVVQHMDNPGYMNFEPCISPDGKHFYFLSNRPDTADAGIGDQDIWVMDRTGEQWSEPYNLGSPVNTELAEFYPSVTQDGTMYFTRADEGSPIHNIYRSRLVDGKYTEPEKLPGQVNCGANRYNAFIAYDESYMIVPAIGMPDSYGGPDYYIVFRNDQDQWSEPINMGDKINSEANGEYSAYVTRDMKYLFFMSTRLAAEENRPRNLSYEILKKLYKDPQNGNSDIYWMNTTFIDNLKPDGF